MKLIRFAASALRRDWRSGELRLIALAVFIAVSSLTTVGYFTNRVERAMELQATELLAADLVLSSSDSIPPDLIKEAKQRGLQYTRTVTFRSVVVHGDQLELSEVKAVEPGYPIRGRLRTASVLFGEEQITGDIPAPGTLWIDSRLLQATGAEMGGELELGHERFRIARLLTYEPDRGGDLFNIAPRVLMNLADLPATGLLVPGSRAQYRLLIGGTSEKVEAFRTLAATREDLNVRGIRDERPELRRTLDRARQFLGLAVLVSVALCGLAIAMSARRYAHRHYDHCALMRCLGAQQAFLSRLYFVQLLILAAGFSALGCVAGYIGQEILARILGDLTQRPLPPAEILPAAAGLIGGIAATLGFALPQLWRLRGVSPLRVFRRDLEPMPAGAITVYTAAILTLALLTPWQSGDTEVTAWVFAGMLGAALLLAVGAYVALRFSARLRSRVGVAWRYGLANLSRRAGGSIAQILAIGLGATVMLVLTLIRTDLLHAWQNRLPPQTPNYFLINVQPGEVDEMRSFLEKNASVTTEFFPMVRGRLVQINDRRVVPDEYQDDRARRLAARETNLSWTDELQPDNRIVAGSWWPAETDDKLYFSVEEGIAETLGIHLGDELRYSIAGREISGTVHNLRSVDWDSFHVNFFVTSNPGPLAGYPATYITSFFLPDARRALLVDLVRRFPSVTVIDIAAVLNQVRSIMAQVAKTVEFVFAFTLVAGLLVLLAALQTTHDERWRESAVLRSLGAARSRVLAGLAAEFTALGLIAGLLGATAAAGIEWALGHFVFELEVVPTPMLWIAGPLTCMIIVCAAGLTGTYRVISVPPVAALRES